MSIVTQRYVLGVSPGSNSPRIRCSMGDTSRDIKLLLYDSGSLFSIPNDVSAVIKGTKSNNVGFLHSCIVGDNYVIFTIVEDMSDVPGIVICEIQLTDSNGGIIGTSNFVIHVEKPALSDDSDIGEVDTDIVTGIITDIEVYKSSINKIVSDYKDETNQTIEDLSESVDNDIAGIRDTVTNAVSVLNARMDLALQELNKHEVQTVLFDDVTNPLAYVDDTATLEADPTTFDYVDFYYKTHVNSSGQGNWDKVFRFEPNSLFPTIVSVQPSDASASNKTLYVHELSFNLSGTTITVLRSRRWYWDGASNTGADVQQSDASSGVSPDNMYGGRVYKIVGVNISDIDELTDLRIGIDGTIYQSAGTAVRTQLNRLNSKSASDISYSNVNSGLSAANVQAAIDENTEELANVNGSLQSQQLGKSPLFDADVVCYVPYYSYTATTEQTWQGNMDAVEFPASDGDVYTMFLSDWNGTGTQRSMVRFFDSEDNILYTKYNDNGYNTAIAPAGTVRAQARAIAIGNSAPIVGHKYWFRNFLVVRGDIMVNDKRISNVVNDVSKLFLEPRSASSIEWEKGYYSSTGKAEGGTSLIAIRSLPSDFIFCGAGSTYQLLSVANGERIRICRYASADESSFIERIAVTGTSRRTFNEDCYIRVYCYFVDDREISDWSVLTDNFVLNAIQLGYVTKAQLDHLSDRVTNLESKLPALPTTWSDKIQTIQTAQGTKFMFAVQTDTHYYVGYGADAAYNLKLLTNYVGFDFVANLGDISRGYSDETIDSPTNMRAAMTDIMNRYITGISCPFMYAMGNHEANSMWVDQYGGEYFSNTELWGRLFRPSFNTNPRAVTQTGKMYYYTDFDDVRVVVLNTQDGVNQNFGIGAEQLVWFRTTALNTDKWVLVMSHVPLINGWSVSSNYVSSYANIVDALVTYKANGGKVIACMSGHTHTKESQTVNDILFVTFRNGGSYAETVMVDLGAKTINTIMLGASGDRSFSF